MATRIQRRRVRHWKKPANAVIVCRPSIFGNPFVGDRAIEAYREWINRVSSGAGLVARLFDVQLATQARKKPWITAQSVLVRLNELRGMDLACYCKVGAQCHADVLLELANTE